MCTIKFIKAKIRTESTTFVLLLIYDKASIYFINLIYILFIYLYLSIYLSVYLSIYLSIYRLADR